MTPSHKTSAILLLAGLTATTTVLLDRRAPATTSPVQPAPIVQDSSGLHVQALLQSTHVLRGVGETHLAVTIQAPVSDGTQVRPPVNLAVVIDRSGSMAGDKLAHAKSAAKQLIAQLSPADRVALIGYGTDVDVLFPSARATSEVKNAAYRAIDRIQDDGGTNLSGGLMAGRDEVARNLESGAVARIVLISDGLANEGITDREALGRLAAETAQRGVSLTTVGVGLDFDERTMTNVAVNGRGNYYFAESSAMLAQMFTDELNKLAATMATNVRLSLTPAPGVEILEAYGYELRREGAHVVVPVADLESGETRKVVLRLRVDARGPDDTMDVADIGVSFHTTESATQRTVNALARTAVTDDAEVVQAGLDRDAVRHIERARTAAIINEATIQYESGNVAAAQQMLQVQRQEVLDKAASLGDGLLADEIRQSTMAADRDFAEAPAASSTEGKRARKANRKRAYDMMY